jgi:hypothetical protein
MIEKAAVMVKTKRYPEAIKLFNDVITFAKRPDRMTSDCYWNLGIVYKTQFHDCGQTDSADAQRLLALAITNFERARLISKDTNKKLECENHIAALRPALKQPLTLMDPPLPEDTKQELDLPALWQDVTEEYRNGGWRNVIGLCTQLIQLDPNGRYEATSFTNIMD